MNNEEGKTYYGIGLDNNQLRADAAQSRNIMKGIGDTTVAEGARVDSAYRKIGGAVAAYFTMQAAGTAVRDIVAVRAEIESLEVAFRSLIGNKPEADALFSSIRKFAVETPMMMGDLSKGAQMMLGFNIEVERIMPLLQQIGDIAMGDSQKFQSLTLAFSQMSATGRLMGQDLLQMINAGLNPLMEISAKTGKSIGQLKKEMEEGGISSQMVSDAFASATAEGGRFFNMLEDQSKAIRGNMSNLMGVIEDAKNEIGEGNQELITGGIAAATNAVRNYKAIGEAMMALTAIYGGYKAAQMLVEALEASRHKSMTKLLTAEQQANLSKIALTKSSVEYSSAVKLEMLAEMDRQTKIAAATAEEIIGSRARLATAKSEKAAIIEKVASRQADLAAAIASGNAEKIAAAQKALDTEQTNLNTASTKVNTASREVGTKKAQIDTAVRRANTLENTMNSNALNGNTVATNILSAAKARLAAITASLNKIIAANKFALLAGAAIALGYAIYRLSQYTTEAEKAQQKLNDAMDDSEKAIGAERAQLDAMFARLKAAKEGTDEYRSAKEAIMSKYSEYLKGLGDEKTALNDVAAAYKLIAEEAEKAARARAMDTYVKNAADDLEQTRKEAKNEVEELLQRKYGNKKGEDGMLLAKTYYAKIKPVIDGKEEITDEIESILKESDRKSGYKSRGTGDWIEVVKNKIREQIEAAQYAKKLFDENLAKATDEFGESQGKKAETLFDVQAASLNQLTEAAKKAGEQLQALRNAKDQDPDAIAAKEKEIQLIDDATRARERSLTVIKDVKARIEELQKENEGFAKTDAEYKDRDARIKYLETKLPDKGAGGAKDDPAKLKLEAAERERQIEQYADAMKKRITQTELELAQASIDASEEGLERTLAQIDLNYKRLRFANQQREEEMLEALRNTREAEWEKSNPKAKDKGETFDRASVTAADLPADAREQVMEFYRIAEEYRIAEAQDALKKMLADFQTYEQQREEIAKRFAKARKDLFESDGKTFRPGVAEGNLTEMGIREREANEAIDIQFAQRETTFRSWMNSIADYTIEALKGALMEAETELKRLETSGTANGADLAIARAKAATARKKLESAEEEKPLTPGERSIKDWQDLYQTLNDVRESFIEVGEAAGGTAGDIIKTAGAMASSTMALIGGIVALANFSITAMKMTAEGASKAMIAAERASLILTIISAALQIVTAMFSLFKQTDYMAKFRAELKMLNHEIELMKLNARIGSDDKDSIFGEDPWARTIENINAAKDAMQLYGAAMDDIKARRDFTGAKAIVADALGIKHSYDSAAESIGKMELKIRHKTMFRSAKYQSLAEALPELFNDDGSVNMDTLETFMGSDMFKKLSQENQAYLQDAADYWKSYQDAVEEVRDYLSDMFGDLGGSITDALVDAFANGTDAAEGFVDSVKGMLEKLAKQMIYSVTIAPLMKEAEKEMLAITQSGLKDDQKYAQYTNVINGLIDDVLAEQTEIDGLLQNAKNAAKKRGIDIFTPDKKQEEAASRGFQTMNQETGSELNGRFTGMQIDMAKIREEAAAIREMGVENKGLRLIAIDYLAGIEKNTRQLYQMNDRLGVIERNTSKL